MYIEEKEGLFWQVTYVLRWERRGHKLCLQQLYIRHYDDLVYRPDVEQKWFDVSVVEQEKKDE